VWALYIFFERLLTIQKLKVDNRFMQQIRDHVFNGNIDAAKAYCRQTNSPIARMIEKGLMRLGKPINEIENAIENAGKVEVFKLEKNLGIMSTIAGLAPMFGFLGTMLGVIKIFYNMAHQASLDQGMIATISEGLYVKMVSSAAGLLVGIIAYSAYHYLNHRIERVINSMEVTAIEFMDLLEEPVKS
jgi:biopolymer transport protein ExbB